MAADTPRQGPAHQGIERSDTEITVSPAAILRTIWTVTGWAVVRSGREAAVTGQTLGQPTLSGAHTAEDQGPTDGIRPAGSPFAQSSMPFWAMIPTSNACLTGRISVTVLAISISSRGAPRPVTTTC